MPWASDGGSAWNATKCTPVDPDPDLPGEPCAVVGSGVSGVDSCAARSMCWDVDPETLEGTCVAFCEGSYQEPSCAPGFYCSIPGNGLPITCLPGCDPLAPDCDANWLCAPWWDGFRCLVDSSGDAGQYGDPCEHANACDPGLVCLNALHVPGCEAGGCCTPFCDTSQADDCPGEGQVCLPWWDEGQAPEVYANVGVCALPL